MSLAWNLPQEMFECLKCCMLWEENGGAVVKNTRCVAELQIAHHDTFHHLFASLTTAQSLLRQTTQLISIILSPWKKLLLRQDMATST